MKALTAYALSKKYTNDTAEQFGAVKGAPCQVVGVSTDTDGNTVVKLQWKNDTAETKTRDVTISKGADGKYITNAELDEDSHLIITLSDGSTIDAGEINGSAELQEDLTATVEIGSVKSGKVYTAGTLLETIIRDILIKVESPVAAIALDPSDTVYDVVNDTVSSIKLTATVTKKTYDIAKIEFLVAGTVVETITTGVSAGGSFDYTYTPATPINSDTTFKVTVTDVEGKTGNASKTIVFVGKSYYGTVDSTIAAPTEDDIKGLAGSTLKTSKVFEQKDITMEYGKVLYAYPASFGAITSIRDEINNITYTNSYTKYEVTVDGIAYFAYLQTDASKAAGITIKYA